MVVKANAEIANEYKHSDVTAVQRRKFPLPVVVFRNYYQTFSFLKLFEFRGK